MKEPTKRTYESFDLWRGLLAIWVVLFHCATNAHEDYLPVIKDSGFIEFLLWSGLRVPMFFVISGYCMSAAAANLIDRNHTIGRFVSARVRRIYPPHLAALALGLAVTTLVWLIEQMGFIKDNPTAAWFTQLNPWLISVNALLLQEPLHERSINDVTWTLCYEVAFYAVIAIAIFVFRKQGWQQMLKVLHVVTLVAFMITIFAPTKAFFPFNHWIGFGEGVLLFDLLCGQPWKERTNKAKIFYSAIFMGIIGLLIAQVSKDSQSPSSWYIVIASCFAILLYFLHPHDAKIKANKQVSSLFFVGTFSYSLYLIHFLVAGILRQFARKMHVPIEFRFFVAEMVVEVAICIAVAYVFYLLVESRVASRKNKPKPVPTSSTGVQTNTMAHTSHGVEKISLDSSQSGIITIGQERLSHKKPNTFLPHE